MTEIHSGIQELRVSQWAAELNGQKSKIKPARYNKTNSQIHVKEGYNISQNWS